MKNNASNQFKTIDEYINSRPEEYRKTLTDLRNTIKTTAPEATESIKYAMPTFELHGHLVYFALCKNHIGFYPMPSGIDNFHKELQAYHCTKGAIQFPLDEALPLSLIKKIVTHRVKENEEIARLKLLKKSHKKSSKQQSK